MGRERKSSGVSDVHYLAIKNWRKYQMYRVDDPYYIKLWAEIDAIRARQLKLAKVAA